MRIRMLKSVKGAADQHGATATPYHRGAIYEMTELWQIQLARGFVKRGDAEDLNAARDVEPGEGKALAGAPENKAVHSVPEVRRKRGRPPKRAPVMEG